jgi:hypothetical protein
MFKILIFLKRIYKMNKYHNKIVQHFQRLIILLIFKKKLIKNKKYVSKLMNKKIMLIIKKYLMNKINLKR